MLQEVGVAIGSRALGDGHGTLFQVKLAIAQLGGDAAVAEDKAVGSVIFAVVLGNDCRHIGCRHADATVF